MISRWWKSDAHPAHLLRVGNLDTTYGHIAIEMDDAYKACELVKQFGGKVIREARVVNAK